MLGLLTRVTKVVPPWRRPPGERYRDRMGEGAAVLPILSSDSAIGICTRGGLAASRSLPKHSTGRHGLRLLEHAPVLLEVRQHAL